MELHNNYSFFSQSASENVGLFPGGRPTERISRAMGGSRSERFSDLGGGGQIHPLSAGFESGDQQPSK